jgi:hypothetical protein
MSMRPPVDRQRILHFLHHLGQRFRRPGRVYLVGGTTLVFEGFRTQTLDVDLTFEVAQQDHGEFIRAVRGLKDELAINVEEASPDDFIPLPEGYQDRAKFVGRFGSLDVYHFDVYSVALSKIERGRDADFADVLALLEAGWLDFETLKRFFVEILPQVGERSLKDDPQEFQRKFSYLEEAWTSGRA